MYVYMNTDTEIIASWYVTGFAERDSSFTYSRSRRGLALYFGMRATLDDAPLLRRIQQALGGVGTIYTRRPAASAARGGTARPSVYFRVTRIGELFRVVSHFDLHPLQGSKRASFEIWRDMVLLKAGPEPAEADQLNLLAAQLSSLAPRNRKRAV